MTRSIHDIAIEGLHVVLCVDRAGIVGADGATHNGVLDVAFLRAIPGDEDFLSVEFRRAAQSCCPDALYHEETGPVAIRYPRGSGRRVPQGCCRRSRSVCVCEADPAVR